jgi:hypothetical protein
MLFLLLFAFRLNECLSDKPVVTRVSAAATISARVKPVLM